MKIQGRGREKGYRRNEGEMEGRKTQRRQEGNMRKQKWGKKWMGEGCGRESREIERLA